MKKAIIAMLTVSILGQFATVSAEQTSRAYYVSVSAEPGGDGSKAHPFQTPEEAQEAVRELNAAGEYPKDGVTVFLREGQYVLGDTLSFDERDSGTEDAPVVWRAYYGEEVTLTTGSSISFSEFTVADDDRIRDEARGKVYKINLTENGYPVHDGIHMTGHVQHYFWNFGMMPGEPWKGTPNPMVLMGDTIGTLARYPNEGYLPIGRMLSNGNVDDGLWYTNDDVGHAIEGEIRGFIMEFDNDRIEDWKDADDAWLWGIFRYDWSDYQVQVKKIDTEKRTIETTHPCNGYMTEGREAWYILNLLEELDAPGEWYCDTKTGDLFIYPPEGLKESDEISLSFQNKNILYLENAKNIVFKDLKLTATRANCVKTAQSCDNISLQYLEMFNTGGQVLYLNGTRIKVTGCHIHDTGTKVGEMLCYGGEKKSDLISSESVFENNWIHDVGKTDNGGGMDFGGNGLTIRNNLFYNVPNTTMGLATNDSIIENNEFHHCLTGTSDAGVIYSVNNVTACGNILRNNVLHDIELKTNEKTESVHAIYLDNYTSGWTITNNVIYNVSGFGIFINMGHANTVTGNIIANARKGVYVNAGRFDFTNLDNTPAYKFEKSMLTDEKWLKYPHIKEMDDPLWWHTRMNKIENNVCYEVSENDLMVNCMNIDAAEVNEKNSFSAGLTVTNENEFVAAAQHNYNLKENSNTLKKIPELANTDMNKASTVTSQIRQAIGENAICFLKGSPEAYVNFEKRLINASNTAVTAFEENGKTYVPLRFIKEQKNGAIEWNSGEILIDFEGTELKLYPNKKEFHKDGETGELSEAIILRDGTSYISATDYADIFGVTVTELENGLVILAKKDVSAKFDEAMAEDLYKRLK